MYCSTIVMHHGFSRRCSCHLVLCHLVEDYNV